MKFQKLYIAIACAFTLFAANAQDNLSAWMANLPDDAKIRELSIPGAHDAATSSLSLTLGGKVQTYKIEEQWEEGVRVFDLRPRENMTIYHSSSTGVTMEDVFSTLKSKLSTNPTEIAIVVIRFERDNPTASQTSTWKSAMKELVDDYDDIIVKFSPSLKVKNARGKILILTRNEFESDKAALLDGWGDQPDTLNGTNLATMRLDSSRYRIRMHLQDDYQYSSDSEKTGAVTRMLNWASENTTEQFWIINHASGYKGAVGTGATSQTNAKLINPLIVDSLSSLTGRTGIIMMDFAGDESSSGQSLVNAIINQNWKYLTND